MARVSAPSHSHLINAGAREDVVQIGRDRSGVQRRATPELRQDEIRCPSCGAELVVRCGPLRAPHFAHRPLQRCAPRSGGDGRRAARTVAAGQTTVFDILGESGGDTTPNDPIKVGPVKVGSVKVGTPLMGVGEDGVGDRSGTITSTAGAVAPRGRRPRAPGRAWARFRRWLRLTT